MIHIDVPTTVRINETDRINLSLCVVSSLVKDQSVMVQTYNDSDEPAAMIASGKTADTVTFWFIGGTPVTYRVGYEITQSEYDRIESIIKSVEFKPKDERNTGNNKADKTA